MATARPAAGARLHVSFEVSGRVQGVFFRKHTAEQAKALALVGWVANHADGCRVVGEAEGSPASVAAFKAWLATTGSPKSVIERAVFSDERGVAAASAPSFADFTIRR